MHVTAGSVEDVHVDLLAHFLVIERIVPVRDDISAVDRVFVLVHALEHVLAVIIGPFVLYVPHLKEHEGKAVCRPALYHDGRVLPDAEALSDIYVLIRKIDAACKGCMSVDDDYLPVVPEVLVSRNYRLHWREHPAVYAPGSEHARIILRKIHHGVGAVVEDSDLDALLDLLPQDFQDLSPHHALLNDEVLHEYEILRLPELSQQSFELVLTEWIVLQSASVVDRIMGFLIHVLEETVFASGIDDKSVHRILLRQKPRPLL